MEHLNQLLNYLEVIFKNFLFSIVIILALGIFYSWIANIVTIIRFKREWRDNAQKFFTKRCVDEGEIKNGRDHIYLVDDKNKKIHRIVNMYTVNKLGYPRPPRVDEKKEENKRFYFSNDDSYKLECEIRIRDIGSIINTIKNLKN